MIAVTTESEDSEDVTFNITRYFYTHFHTHPELDDLVIDSSLTKETSEVLRSRLNEWNLLNPNCKNSMFRKRHQIFLNFSKFWKVICFVTVLMLSIFLVK